MRRITKVSHITKKSIRDAFIVVSCAIMSQLGVSFHVLGQQILMTGIAVFGLLLYFRLSKSGALRKEYNDIFLAAIPFAFAFVYTVIVVTFSNEYNLDIIPQAFTSTGFAFVQMMFVGTIILLYKEKGIDIAYYIIVVSYGITIAFTLSQHGVGDILRNWNTLNNYLERHDIGVSVVSVILYYVFRIRIDKDKNNRNIWRIIVMAIILILNGKRSAILALVFGFLAMYIFNRKIKYKLRFCYLLSVLVILLLYTSVVLVQTGTLQNLTNQLGYTALGRIHVWSWFSNQYNVTPLYFGKGFQYVHKYMSAYIAEGGSSNSIVSMFGYLHNSDLQLFIELGFWGFFTWLSFYLFFYPFKLRKKYGSNTYYFAFVLMISMVSMYLVDNTLTYPVYQTTTYICLFNYVIVNKQETRMRLMRLYSKEISPIQVKNRH